MPVRVGIARRLPRNGQPGADHRSPGACTQRLSRPGTADARRNLVIVSEPIDAPG